ncbi:MAG TPA: peptidylprolyl isomerase [Steroidobacteraceae bacterium]|jgi:FKBP-type peptidyl-prolyl cis-trans isomerase SlyD|nr:peptidylprolyl isomerase [Steroidobacteraceae bacterium]
MPIADNDVVTFHYTLKGDTDEVIDSSAGGEPLAYLHGRGNIVPGLERELTGKSVGDRLQVRVPAAQGYGEYDRALVQKVPRRALKGIDNLRVGLRLQAGHQAVTVKHIAGDMITLDGNHPLAGQDLNFDVEITAVRPATEEELAHGHVHGDGGHHH